MHCVSEIYSTEIWIPWLGVACADVRRCHTPVLVQLARAPCLGEQLEIPFVSQQTMHPSCTLMTKSSHPGARLEEVFARGQRIGGGKKVQRIGTACRKWMHYIMQSIGTRNRLQYNDSINEFYSSDSISQFFYSRQSDRGHLDPTHFRVILCAGPASDSLCHFEKDGWLNRSASGIYVHNMIHMLRVLADQRPLQRPSWAPQVWNSLVYVMKVEVILLKKEENSGQNSPQLESFDGRRSLTLGELQYIYLKVLSKSPPRFLQPLDIRREHHTISSAMLSHLISPTNPNN